MQKKNVLLQKDFVSRSAAATKQLGTAMAHELRARPLGRHAIVVGLQGELGSGKTTFVQGFAKGLGIKEKVLSPTFVIVKSYKIQDTRYKIQNLYHVDCYRTEKPGEILALGWKEIIRDPSNIVLVEWPERIKRILPRDIRQISFHALSKDERQISLL